MLHYAVLQCLTTVRATYYYWASVVSGNIDCPAARSCSKLAIFAYLDFNFEAHHSIIRDLAHNDLADPVWNIQIAL